VLFFVHTSLVLMLSMQRMERLAENGWVLTAAFWLRRIFRIYPLSILTVIVVALVHVPVGPYTGYSPISAKVFWTNLFLIQNIVAADRNVLAVLWSLPPELQMYLLLPFAFFLIRGGRGYRALVLWGLSVTAAIFWHSINWRLGVLGYAPCFMSGVVAFDLLRARAGFMHKAPAWIWPVGILAAIALFGPFEQAGLSEKYARAWGLSLAVAVLYVSVREATPGRLHAVLHWIAEHSYGIYLSHSILFWFAVGPMAGFPMWVRIAFLIVSCVAVPAVLYRYVERPLMLAGNHLSRRILHPHVAHVAA
jgi:peptidoglycan/LPS O-acetylase OafA/YrhL